MFVAAGILAILIVLITTNTESIKAAFTNPAKKQRSE